MVNPFDPRTVLLAKHAQHVMLIHFPIALFTSGVAFDLISRGRPTSSWASAAYLNLTAAAITVFPVLGTGLLAWQFVLVENASKACCCYISSPAGVRRFFWL